MSSRVGEFERDVIFGNSELVYIEGKCLKCTCRYYPSLMPRPGLPPRHKIDFEVMPRRL